MCEANQNILLEIWDSQMETCLITYLQKIPKIGSMFLNLQINKTHRYRWYSGSTSQLTVENMNELNDHAYLMKNSDNNIYIYSSLFSEARKVICRVPISDCQSKKSDKFYLVLKKMCLFTASQVLQYYSAFEYCRKFNHFLLYFDDDEIENFASVLEYSQTYWISYSKIHFYWPYLDMNVLYTKPLFNFVTVSTFECTKIEFKKNKLTWDHTSCSSTEEFELLCLKVNASYDIRKIQAFPFETMANIKILNEDDQEKTLSIKAGKTTEISDEIIFSNPYFILIFSIVLGVIIFFCFLLLFETTQSKEDADTIKHRSKKRKKHHRKIPRIQNKIKITDDSQRLKVTFTNEAKISNIGNLLIVKKNIIENMKQNKISETQSSVDKASSTMNDSLRGQAYEKRTYSSFATFDELSETRENKDFKDERENKDYKDSKDNKDNKDNRENKDNKDNKVYKDKKDNKENKLNKEKK